MREIVLDTNAYSLAKKGHKQVLQLIAESPRIWMPSIVIGELSVGYLIGSRHKENFGELEDFLSTDRVHIANVNKRTTERYASIYVWLRSQGKPIPTNDVWIAAIAMEKGADLVSADAHFERVPQIQLIGLQR